jgi:hypothetical protein
MSAISSGRIAQGTPTTICGYEKGTGALEWGHRDPPGGSSNLQHQTQEVGRALDIQICTRR